MIEPSLRNDFPIMRLPLVATNSALELQRNTGVPLVLIAASMLTAMSLAIQGQVNVKRMDGLEGPVSAWYLIIGESGERKTAIDEKALLPIREFDREHEARYKKEMEQYKIALLAWELEQKVILAEFKKGNADEQSSDRLGRRLEDHAAGRPKKPRCVRLLYSDVTPAATKNAFNDNWNSIGLVSDEGVSMLSGQALEDLGFLNSAWGGANIRVDRANKESVIVDDPRLTISIMVQLGPLLRYFARKDGEVSDTGHLARYHVAFPRSTQGTRFIDSTVISWQHLPIFQERIRKLADANVGQDGEPVERVTLSFSPQALERWILAHNNIEQGMNPGGSFRDIKGYAAKLADNIARLAALFHHFDGNSGPISIETLENAIAVEQWFADEFCRLFAPELQLPQEDQDANALEIWVAQQIAKRNQLADIQRNKLLQFGPVALRAKARMDPALDVLVARGVICFYEQGRRKMIGLNPDHFTRWRVNFLCDQAACGASMQTSANPRWH